MTGGRTRWSAAVLRWDARSVAPTMRPWVLETGHPVARRGSRRVRWGRGGRITPRCARANARSPSLPWRIREPPDSCSAMATRSGSRQEGPCIPISKNPCTTQGRPEERRQGHREPAPAPGRLQTGFPRGSQRTGDRAPARRRPRHPARISARRVGVSPPLEWPKGGRPKPTLRKAENRVLSPDRARRAENNRDRDALRRPRVRTMAVQAGGHGRRAGWRTPDRSGGSSRRRRGMVQRRSRRG